MHSTVTTVKNPYFFQRSYSRTAGHPQNSDQHWLPIKDCRIAETLNQKFPWRKNQHPNPQNFYSLKLLKMKDLLKFSTENKNQPKTKTKSSQVVKWKSFLSKHCLGRVWVALRLFMAFHDFFPLSKAGPAVLGVSQDEPGSLMALCFPPALSKRGKLVLQDR